MAKAKILVVEDNAIIAEGMQVTLESSGYDIIVSSSKKAIEKAKEMKPDLVLMDIMLIGDINVKEAIKPAEEIHKRFNIPVIYVSTYIELLQKIKPESYLLSKPFTDEELLAIVGNAL